MNRVTELEMECSQLRAKVAELEKAQAERPLTVRRLKDEISEVIGAKLSQNHPYAATISRDDLLKIHAWIVRQK